VGCGDVQLEALELKLNKKGDQTGEFYLEGIDHFLISSFESRGVFADTECVC